MYITRMGQVSEGVGEVETEEASGEGFQETDREMDEGGGMPRVKRETPPMRSVVVTWISSPR